MFILFLFLPQRFCLPQRWRKVSAHLFSPATHFELFCIFAKYLSFILHAFRNTSSTAWNTLVVAPFDEGPPNGGIFFLTSPYVYYIPLRFPMFLFLLIRFKEFRGDNIILHSQCWHPVGTWWLNEWINIQSGWNVKNKNILVPYNKILTNA